MKKVIFLIKLKLLKLIYLNKINTKLKKTPIILFSNYINIVNYNSLNLFQLDNYLLTNNRLFYFKNQFYNQFFFYNFNLINKINSKLNKTLTNYNFKYLFFYMNYNYLKSQNNYSISNFYLNNLFFIKYFIVRFIYFYMFDKNILFNIKKNKLLVNDKVFNSESIINKIRRLNYLKEVNILPKIFLELILVFLYSKDVIFFKNALKYILENTHLRKHKRFLYNLKILLNFILDNYNETFNVLGLFIKIKGKIGVGGNSKKKKYNFKKGSFSFTKKDQKLSYNKDVIRTDSGVLGFEIYLTYK
jgi:hypothetical protein